MKSLRLVHLVLSSLLLPLALSAVETLPIYVGAGYGIARYVGDDVKDPLLLTGQQAEDDQGFYEVYVGLDLGDLLSIEVAYAQFNELEDSYDLSDEVVSIVTPNYRERVDFARLSAMAVLEYPLTLGFSIYGTGGYAYYDFDRYLFGGFSESIGATAERIANGDHGLEFGFGAKWEALDRISVRGQWAQSVIGDRKVQSNRLSVEFHF